MSRRYKYGLQWTIIVAFACTGFVACTSKKNSSPPPPVEDGRGIQDGTDSSNGGDQKEENQNGDRNKVTNDGQPRVTNMRGSEGVDTSKGDLDQIHNDDMVRIREAQDIEVKGPKQVTVTTKKSNITPLGAPGPGYDDEPDNSVGYPPGEQPDDSVGQPPCQQPAPPCKGSPVDPVPAQDVAYQYESYQTGATDGRGHFFTDSKNDHIMGFLREQIDKMTGEYKQDSLDLAASISDLLLEVDIKETGAVGLAFSIESGPGRSAANSVKVEMRGFLNSSRQATLQQTLSTDPNVQFRAYVTCMDVDTNACQHAVITLDQVENGEVCKTAYIIHRWGDAAVTTDPVDFRHLHEVPNVNYRIFSEIMGNTLEHNVLSSKNLPVPNLLPRFKAVGLRTFAVAYGSAAFRVSLKTHESISDPWVEIASFMGPLLEGRRGELLYNTQLYNVATGEVIGNPGNTFGDRISSVYIEDNDGMGNLDMNIIFKGSPSMNLRVRFETRLNPARNPFQL